MSNVKDSTARAYVLGSIKNLKRLKGGEEINLPASAFTVREKEWLQGSGIIPGYGCCSTELGHHRAHCGPLLATGSGAAPDQAQRPRPASLD